MRLTLKSEHLAALTNGEMSEVVGGNQYSAAGLTCPLLRCDLQNTWVTCPGGCQIPPESVVC